MANLKSMMKKRWYPLSTSAYIVAVIVVDKWPFPGHKTDYLIYTLRGRITFKVISSKFVLRAIYMFYFQVYFNGGLCFGVFYFQFLFSPSIGVFLNAFSIICVDLMIFPRSSQIVVCANMLRNYLMILCCISFISLHYHDQFASMKFPHLYHSSFNV